MPARPHTAGPTVMFMPGHTPGDRLRQLRDRLGLSLRGAAERAETISYSTIRNLEQKPGSFETSEIATLQALARGYGISLERLVAIATMRDDAPDIAEEAFEQAKHLEVHPQWIKLPVYGVADAGDLAAAEPLVDEVVYIPREHLTRRGSAPSNIRVFQVNGSCMVSDEARRAEKNYAPGDYIAIDTDKVPQPGDIVVAWWEEREMLVIKRYAIDQDGIVLHPLASTRTPITLPHGSPTRLLGPVVWRGG